MSEGPQQRNGADFPRHILFVTAIVSLPLLFGPLFEWVHGITPLLVFYFLHRYGKNAGGKYILFGWLLAGMTALAVQQTGQLIFSLTLVPAGFVLADSVERKESLHMSGMKTALAIAASWFAVSSLLAIGLTQHPYGLLLKSLTQGMDEAMAYYTTNASLPADTLYLLETTFQQMQIWIPKVLPAILSCIILMIVWFTMVLGNKLLQKKTGEGPWPEYKLWKLPDQLVWSVIISGALVVLPVEPGKTIGLNLLIITGLLYSFQGIAVMLFYFYKWSVPVFLRTLIYVILFFQSFGAIFLALLGMADIWFDIRRLQNTENETDT